ncbi:hypothetical protein [Nevskia ramosa]|uniref:hypothetical protein n=1 Tax=Nevskia ramosa TaxID=64002 RepID=UPI003D0F29E6
MNVPPEILEIGRRLLADREQNDHCTADPMFVVQKKRRIYGFDTSYCTRTVWLDSECESTEVPAKRARVLDRRDDRGDKIPPRYERTGYIDEWEHVTTYLTSEAAHAYCEAKAYEGELRVYVDSGCRNHEWKAMQAFFMGLARELVSVTESNAA